MNRKTLTGSRLLHEEGRGFFQDLPLLTQRAHLAAQPAQLLTLFARQTRLLTRVDRRLLRPQSQRLRRDAEIVRDLPQRPTATAIQRDSLTPKLRGYGF
jgi:hypothetical protein